jgi:predicted phosphodiesterase
MVFMSKIKQFFKSTTYPAILLTLSVIGIIFFYAGRNNWIFIELSLGKEGILHTLLPVLALNSVLLCVLTLLRKHKINGDEKWYSALLIPTSLATFFVVVFAIVYTIVALTGEAKYATILYLKDSLLVASLLVFVPFSVLFLPNLKSKSKKITTAVILTVTLLIGIYKIFPVIPYKITSAPTVIDNGTEYSVIFSTNNYGTGYVEYNYNGKDYKLYDEMGGRLNTNSKIHSVSVPYEHLRNNTYSIGSTQVFEQYSYGSHRGKTVNSEKYTLKYNDSENQTFLVISDWHTELKDAYKAVSYVGDYDSVILLGDSSPGVDFEEEVIRNIVEFAGEIAKGTKPVIYARGNHETRGEYAGKLLISLGLEEFYYTTDIGPYSFLILDSGEDKEDSHPEYGGMNNYRQYRVDMIDWMKKVNFENEKVITISHSWQICDVEKELSVAGWNEIDRIGTRLILSGHTHQCRLLGTVNDETENSMLSAHPDIIGYMDGGKSNDSYIASKMTLSPEGFTLEAYNNNGEKVFDENFVW